MRASMLLALLILLPMVQTSFAQLSSPPVAEVMGNNTIAAAALDGYYDNASARNATITLRFPPYSQALNLSASVAIIGLSPSIDDMSCAMPGMAVILSRGVKQGHLTSLPSEGYPNFLCDRHYFENLNDYAWRCDFDADTCVEYENKTDVRYDMNVTFSFRNYSESVPFTSTYIPVPSSILNQTLSASGAENMTVSVSGNVTFVYQVDNRSFGYGDCGSNASNVTQSIPFSTNRSFIVGGNRKLFFLRAPVLREQWFRDNRFDMVVLSQCPLYSARIYQDGNASRNITLRTFYVNTTPLGIQEMRSNMPNKSNRSGWSESRNLSTPTPLERSGDSYLFAYEFNHTYAGLGTHNLSLRISDAALSDANYSDSFLSRMLSHDNLKTETGEFAALYPSRPSAEPSRSTLTQITLGLGLISLVLILAFVNNWLLK